MKNARTIPLILAATIASSALAAGPFQVRRGLERGSLDDTSTVAVVSTAPFDESSLRSHDAESYFYAVYDADGNALDVSVDKLAVTGLVRIGFDDGDPGSAPVGAGTSSVAAAPASIRADGLQIATITIVPRDEDGNRLGRGLSVSIDAALLWPLVMTGPIQDTGDGSYRVDATSIVPGTGSVRAVVEGVVLASQPVVEATTLGPLSMRDLAILQLRDLTSAGGRLDAPDLRPARNAALEALRTLTNAQPARDDNALKTDLDASIRQLEAMGTPEAEALIDDLLDIARMIGVWNVEQARAECGSCPRADWALAEAEALFADPDAEPTAVVDAYAWAVEMALQARQICNL